ncbi:MAG: TonB-dependent receptor [Pseudomonadota bacterium]
MSIPNSTPRRAQAGLRLCMLSQGIALAGLNAGVSAAAAAQSPGAIPNNDPDTDIVVTANRTPAPRSEVGSAITVITAQDIETAQFQIVADALALSPGVNLARNSAFGGLSSITLRGAASRQTLVLIDGIVVNDPSSPGGGFNFANLDVADIDAIEVLRGPQSILYGSEAIGGVVSIRTRRPDLTASDTSPDVRAFVEGGSFATVRAGAGFSGVTGNFDYRASVFGTRTNGISRADSDDGNTERDGFESIATSANLGYTFSPVFRAETFLRYGTSATEFDGFPPPNFTLADSDDNDSAEEYVAGGRLIGRLFDGRFTNTLTAGYSRIERSNFSGEAQTFSGVGDRLSFDYLAQATLADGFAITAGGETERTTIDTGTVIDDVRINSVFGLATVKPFAVSGLADGAGELTITGGLRLDDHETFGAVTTARFTGAWAFPALGATLRGSWGEGFSAPTLFQLNFVFGAGEPNRDLQPEQSRGWDLGLEFAPDRLPVTLQATYFNQDTDNLIDFNFATGAFFNINESRQRGVETQFAAELTPRIRLTTAYTYTDSIDVQTGLQALRQPRHRAFTNIIWAVTDMLTTSAGITYNGRERDTDFVNDVFIDSFVRLDLRAEYQLSEQFQLFGRIGNATDANYQDILGFGEPGIAVFGGIRFRQ